MSDEVDARGLLVPVVLADGVAWHSSVAVLEVDGVYLTLGYLRAVAVLVPRDAEPTSARVASDVAVLTD